MKKIGLGLDYNNICTDYNTVYLDRDNTDPDTVACMKSVMRWLNPLLSELLETFDYGIYRVNHDILLKLEDIVQKRFLFYSLEKELTAQTFIIQKEAVAYPSLIKWAEEDKDGLVIQNDDEGEGIYFYATEGSAVHTWLLEKLSDYSVDEIPFNPNGI